MENQYVIAFYALSAPIVRHTSPCAHGTCTIFHRHIIFSNLFGVRIVLDHNKKYSRKVPFSRLKLHNNCDSDHFLLYRCAFERIHVCMYVCIVYIYSYFSSSSLYNVPYSIFMYVYIHVRVLKFQRVINYTNLST